MSNDVDAGPAAGGGPWRVRRVRRAPACRAAAALLCVALAAVAGAADRAPVVAIVTDAEGVARTVTHQRAAEHPATAILDGLEVGDTLVLEPGAHLAVSFPGPHGAVFDLGGPGRFEIQALRIVARAPSGELHRRALPAALRSLQIKPALAAQASIAMRGRPGSAPGAALPSGRQSLASARMPRWPAPGDGPWKYHVRLIDDDGNVAFETDTDANQATVPEAIALARGLPYIWSVDAAGVYGRKGSIAAEFTVVDDATDQAVSAARASGFEQPADQVLFALALEQSGLVQDAAEQWHSLSALRPQLALRAR